jgi:uncharacterized membrane protein YbhN (UPF0104 family)
MVGTLEKEKVKSQSKPKGDKNQYGTVSIVVTNKMSNMSVLSAILLVVSLTGLILLSINNNNLLLKELVIASFIIFLLLGLKLADERAIKKVIQFNKN